MNELVKKAIVSMAAAVVCAIGHSLGDVAKDAIKDRWDKKPEKPEPKKRGRR